MNPRRLARYLQIDEYGDYYAGQEADRCPYARRIGDLCWLVTSHQRQERGVGPDAAHEAAENRKGLKEGI